MKYVMDLDLSQYAQSYVSELVTTILEQQGARVAELSIMGLTSLVYCEKVIEAMPKAPDKHPESYVRLVGFKYVIARRRSMRTI